MFTRHKPPGGGGGRGWQEHFHKLLGTEVRSPRALRLQQLFIKLLAEEGHLGNHRFRRSLVELTGEVRAGAELFWLMGERLRAAAGEPPFLPRPRAAPLPNKY